MAVIITTKLDMRIATLQRIVINTIIANAKTHGLKFILHSMLA